MNLNNLQPAEGSTKTTKRIGRGQGSGRGGTSTRGHKGQKSRSGASIPGWFEGGQTPVHVRVPKLRGFKPVNRIDYQVVNVGRISEYAAAGRFGDTGSGPITVNGEVRQDANTRQMIFPIPEIIAFVSKNFTLEAGDIITTGTPPGVGLGMKPPQYLKAGDVVELSIEQLGHQRQEFNKHEL